MASSDILLVLVGACAVSPSLASVVDLIVPFYSVAVSLFLYTVYSSPSSPSSPAASKPAVTPPPRTEEEEEGGGRKVAPRDLSGEYKLVSNENYQKFLEVGALLVP